MVIPNINKLEIFPKNWPQENLFKSEVDSVIQMNKVCLNNIFRNFMKVKRNATFEGILSIIFGVKEVEDQTQDDTMNDESDMSDQSNYHDSCNS